MEHIFGFIHSYAPKEARLVGFVCDVMGFGKGNGSATTALSSCCHAAPATMPASIPSCWPSGVWDSLAPQYPYVNSLGLTSPPTPGPAPVTASSPHKGYQFQIQTH
eukprot:TRINITY_DN5153_c0_g4_i1.p2 TRINITY_DN5153_c0_g4~~TRINITY_DN5153_c0_g4_i1.p2  ORF type:complete len:106 (+),score=8.47 TRINITY_DN5153_c0_g4_i1:243-560(+)